MSWPFTLKESKIEPKDLDNPTWPPWALLSSYVEIDASVRMSSSTALQVQILLVGLED